MTDEALPPLAQLRKRYVEGGAAMPRALERRLADDPRKGAQAVLAAVRRRRKKNRAEGQRLRKVLEFERALWSEGLTYVAGVDEAGMSPLAGPVTAGAVILPVEHRIPRVDDSKRLDAKTREELAVVIKREAVAWAIGEVEPEEIDKINIYRAGLLAMQRAVEGLGVTPEHLLIDARKVALDIPQQAIIKGDQKSHSIAAASILAKTTRDRRMVGYDAEYPGYGFAQHKGYPVREHQDALAKLGATPIHRRSYKAVREALGIEPEQLCLPGGSAPGR